MSTTKATLMFVGCLTALVAIRCWALSSVQDSNPEHVPAVRGWL